MKPDVDLTALIRRFNPVLVRVFQTAAGLSGARCHDEVTPDHWLHCLLDESNCDVQLALKRFEIDESRLRKLVTRTLELLPAKNAAKPRLSDEVFEWWERGWLYSSIDLGQTQLRSAGLILAAVAHPGRYLSVDYLELFEPVSKDMVVKQFDSIFAGSSERDTVRFGPSRTRSGIAEHGVARRAPDSALARFSIDFTAQARDGKIDPVFGRESEIRQMIDILGRRRKNNPIVVGEAGVGKTAVVEGLALRIVQGDVPPALRRVDLICLDLGLLQAGAGVRGEFENRLKMVIDEVKASETPVILFIDEAHTLIGAGGPQGGGDAANLLKPALARGELRTIAATTWAEYKKYFEKDAALSRRFQVVKLDEPSEDDAAVMLRGIKMNYEAAHGVTIRDDAVVAAVKLSSRYLSGRQLPDKAIDLLDTCASRVGVARVAPPPELQDLRKRAEALERERDSVARDSAFFHLVGNEKLADLEASLAGVRESEQALTAQWDQARRAAQSVLELRASFVKSPEDEETRARLATATREMEEHQQDKAYVPVEVDPEVVARTVSDWTGIPLGEMVRDQASALLDFEARMATRIKGQQHALEIVGRALRAAKAGIGNPAAPMGVFHFVGPSGVGKTETALGIAELLFGGERFISTINMSEYQERHTVSLLKGAPPGYVGYGEGGVLTEAVRQRPHSVVLLDEAEKAHLSVLDLFYQVFDKGILTDGTGRDINFRNTVIILTSNIAADVITRMCAAPVPPDMGEVTAAIRPLLAEHFRPALNARWRIVPFLNIGPDVMRDVAVLKLGRVSHMLRGNHGITLSYDRDVVSEIASRCSEVDTGARNVDYVIEANLLPQIATHILEQLATGDVSHSLHIGIASDGSFDLRWDGAPSGAGAQ